MMVPWPDLRMASLPVAAGQGAAEQSQPSAAVQAVAGTAGERHRPQEAKTNSGLELLLKIEAEARRVADLKELNFLMVNESMKLSRARQVFLLVGEAGGKWRVTGVSSVSHFDHKSAQVQWIEAIVKSLQADAGLAKLREFDLPGHTPPGDSHHATYPFKNMLWTPFLTRDGKLFAGLLAARDTPWAEADRIVLRRLSDTFAHAWLALAKPRIQSRHLKVRPALLMAFLATGACAAGTYPIPLTVLAPMEISSEILKTVAAPVDGIVDALLVDNNTPVEAGMPVIRMSDTALRNEEAVARGEYAKTKARLKRVVQAAIYDEKALREIAIVRSEAEVAKAKLDYASELLSRTTVKSPASGVAVYSDKRDWTGRPVQTGERVMDIADPSRPELRIFIPVRDAIAVQQGMRVRAFLDSDPLHAREAIVANASYEARPHAGGELAYQVTARFNEAIPEGLRLGVRGTAQVYGADVPLAFYLFRKPYAVVRQWLGM
jgi:hypothetical protein